MSLRTRNFATIIYPDSAPKDWLNILESFCIPCFVSPLHRNDIESTGEPKKPHYHVMLMFSGVKTQKQALELITQLNGVGLIAVNDIRAMARYFCHLDSYEKAQYSIEDVLEFGGANYYETINLSSDKYNTIREMIQWCTENKIQMYSDLLTYASIHKNDWFRVLCDSGTMVMKEFLKSSTYSMNQQKKNKVL